MENGQRGPFLTAHLDLCTFGPLCILKATDIGQKAKKEHFLDLKTSVIIGLVNQSQC